MTYTTIKWAAAIVADSFFNLQENNYFLYLVIVKICREAFRSINKPPKEPQEKFAFLASLFGSKSMIVLTYLVIQKKKKKGIASK